jgi:hypothetical protein
VWSEARQDNATGERERGEGCVGVCEENKRINEGCGESNPQPKTSDHLDKTSEKDLDDRFMRHCEAITFEFKLLSAMKGR